MDSETALVDMSTGDTKNNHPEAVTAHEDSSQSMPPEQADNEASKNAESGDNEEKESSDVEDDNSSDPKTVDGFTDYNQIYESLQARFNKSYALSQKLFVTEKTQRQTLYHYKRRVNALLDVLRDIEGESAANIDEPLQIDHDRLASLVTWRPELKECLQPALDISDGSMMPSQIPLKRSYGANLAVDEMIPELPNDELDTIELNPQDTDMWIRRHFSHLVVSKFRPAEIRAKGVREYVDPLAFGARKKKRS
ncbi:hypothetical protein OXX79_008178 [Metschnikowia pulcherrima]